MAELALQRIPRTDSQRRGELISLKEDVLDAQRGLTCHVAKLPIELLVEVFTLLGQTHVLDVSHVCKHWRDVALSTPALWSTLILTKKDPVRKTDWWIQHSKGRISELSLRRSLHDNHAWSLDNLNDLHWEQLVTCRLEDWDIYPYLKQRSMLSVFSTLYELELIDKDSRPQRDFLFTHADPLLRRLRLDGVAISLQSLRHLKNLQILIITGDSRTSFSFEALINILEANPMLHTLILQPNPRMVTIRETCKVTMQHLQYLDIQNVNLYSNIFDAVTFPNVSYLSVAYGPIDSMLSTLADAGPPLAQLSLKCCTFSSLPLINLLRKCHLIKMVEITYCQSTVNPVVEALATPLDALSPDLPCPMLSHLNLSGCSDVKSGPISRLVESRIRGDQLKSDIQFLKIDSCPLVDAEFLPWFRQRVKNFSCVYLTKQAAKYRR